MNKIIESDVIRFVENFKFLSNIKCTKILVTGATGLIGASIIRCLLGLNEKLDANIQIIGLVRNLDKARELFPNATVKWINHDLSNPFELRETSIDYIFHCACPTSSKFYIEQPVELIKISFQSTLSLLDYAIKNPIKGMVYLSSCEVYGQILSDIKELTEDQSGYINPIDVRSGYPMAKRLVECLCHSYCKEYNIPVYIARLTQTFGAGVSAADNRVFAQFAKSAINNSNIIMHTKGESAKPYCYTIDAINAFFYMLFFGKAGEAYNVANSSSYMSIYELAHYISNNFSEKSKVIIEEKTNMGYAPITKLKMSTKKIEELGWSSMYSTFEMFNNLINYYRQIL